MQKQIGRPGPFYHVNDISVYLGRQRGGGVPFHACVLHFEPGAVCFLLPKHSKLQHLGVQKLQDKVLSLFFHWGTLLSSGYPKIYNLIARYFLGGVFLFVWLCVGAQKMAKVICCVLTCCHTNSNGEVFGRLSIVSKVQAQLHLVSANST